MKSRPALSFAISACAADAVLAWTAQAVDAAVPLALVLLVHAALASLVAFFVVLLARTASAPAPLSFAVLPWLLAFFVPVFGGLATLVTVAGLLRPRVAEERVELEQIAFPSLAVRPVPTKLARGSPHASLVHVVRSDAPLESRFNAILVASRLAPAVAVPVLKAGLSDAAEEVRLTAFSQLEQLRRTIERRMQLRKESLVHPSHEGEALELHRFIAEDAFEIAYLGLAEGEVYKHVLGEAESHASAAIALDPSAAGLYLLRARVRLRQHQPDLAEMDLAHARALGLPEARVAPYAAEVAFLRGDDDVVMQRLAALEGQAHDHAQLSRVAEFWRWR